MLFNGTVHTSNKFGNLLLNLCPRMCMHILRHSDTSCTHVSDNVPVLLNRTIFTRHKFSNKLWHIFVYVCTSVPFARGRRWSLLSARPPGHTDLLPHMWLVWKDSATSCRTCVRVLSHSDTSSATCCGTCSATCGQCESTIRWCNAASTTSCQSSFIRVR